MRHGAGGAGRGGQHGPGGGHGWGRIGRGGGPARARGRARRGGSSTGALCTEFTLQSVSIKGMNEMFVRLDDGTNFEEAFFF